MGFFAESNFDRCKSHPKSPARPAFRKIRIPFIYIEFGCAIADAMAIILASLLSAIVYRLLAGGDAANLKFSLGAGAAAAALYLLIRRHFATYRSSEILSTKRNSSRMLSWWVLAILLLTSLAFVFKISSHFSRGSTILFVFIGFALLLAAKSIMKVAVKSALRNGRLQGRRVVLLGLEDELGSIDKIHLLKTFGFTEVERVALAANAVWDLSTGTEIDAAFETVLASARKYRAEEIVLALSWNDIQQIEVARQYFQLSPLTLRLLPDRKVRYLSENGGLDHAISIEIKRPPLSSFDQAMKRGLDISVGLLALLLLAPLLLIVALAIKLDSRGPVLFRQNRMGFNSTPFSILKFRTMSVMENGPDVIQAKRGDWRVTRIGRVLRESSVDELPQLWNVLKGDMSLVGPRPHAMSHDTYYGKQLSEYANRHHVKPGITGWAQINGCRGETSQLGDMKRRLDLDLWYIGNWALARDIGILLKTPFAILLNRNAY